MKLIELSRIYFSRRPLFQSNLVKIYFYFYLFFFLDDNDDKDVCKRVWDWEPQKCTSAMTRYYYSPTATSNCISMDFGGCLGNTNNFATPDACSRTCTNSGL